MRIDYERIPREIPEKDLPPDLRWEVSPEDQGQIVEVAHAYSSDPDYPVGRYRRVIDRSEPVGSPDRVSHYWDGTEERG